MLSQDGINNLSLRPFRLMSWFLDTSLPHVFFFFFVNSYFYDEVSKTLPRLVSLHVQLPHPTGTGQLPDPGGGLKGIIVQVGFWTLNLHYVRCLLRLDLSLELLPWVNYLISSIAIYIANYSKYPLEVPSYGISNRRSSDVWFCILDRN